MQCFGVPLGLSSNATERFRVYSIMVTMQDAQTRGSYCLLGILGLAVCI